MGFNLGFRGFTFGIQLHFVYSQYLCTSQIFQMKPILCTLEKQQCKNDLTNSVIHRNVRNKEYHKVVYYTDALCIILQILLHDNIQKFQKKQCEFSKILSSFYQGCFLEPS